MVSQKPWRPDAVLLLAAGLLLSACLGSSIKILLDSLLPKQSFATQSFYGFILGALSFQGAGVVFIHFFLKLHGFTWKEFLGTKYPTWKKSIGLAVGAAALATPLILFLNQLSAWIIKLFHQEPKEQMVMQVLHGTLGWGQRICFAITAVVLAPIVEESLFRGILYPVLKQHGYPILALAGTSLLFAAIHGSLLTFMPLTFFALILVVLYERTDSLIAPMVTHALFNTSNLILYFVMPSK